MPKRVSSASSVRKRKDRRNGKRALITAIMVLINPCGPPAFSNINRKVRDWTLLHSGRFFFFFNNAKTLEE